MLERVFPDGERLVELGVGEHERAEDADRVAVHAGLQQQQPSLHRRVDHGLGELGRGLLRRAVGDELDREHGAEAAHVADGREALLPGEHPRAQRLADRDGALAEALLVDHVEDGERRGLGDGVADERAADGAVVRRVHDLRLAEHARERQAGGDRLGDGDQVGLDAVVLDREQLAGAREAGLHLVDDQADPVLVADRAQPLHELLSRGQEAALALDRLDDDRRDLLGRHLRDEELPQLGERGARVGAAVVLREGRAVDLGRERPHPDLVRVRARGERHRQQRAAVEGALEGDHGGSLGVEPRELDGVLDRLGAGVEEGGLGGPAERRALEQPLGELDVGLVGNDREVGVRKRATCSVTASITRGCAWPTFRQPTPPVKSMKTLPSTSVSVAPRPSCATIGSTIVLAFAITRCLRARISAERGPGIAVRMSIVFVVAMSSTVAHRPAGMNR